MYGKKPALLKSPVVRKEEEGLIGEGIFFAPIHTAEIKSDVPTK
jgi:hypothetical protein